MQDKTGMESLGDHDHELELHSTFRRYWVKILPDGSCLAQFDQDGNYVLWDDSIPAKEILFIPFSKSFAALVRSKGDTAFHSNLPVLKFPVVKEVLYHRHVTIRHEGRLICHYCGAFLEDNAKVCPRCLGTNWYYCDLCDSLKDPKHIKVEVELVQVEGGSIRLCKVPPYFLNPLARIHKLISNIPGWYIKTYRIMCPDCKEPRGLLWVGCIIEDNLDHMASVGKLDVDGERHIIIDSLN